MQLFIVIVTLLGILRVAFAMQNDVPVTATLLVWRVAASLDCSASPTGVGQTDHSGGNAITAEDGLQMK